MTVSHLNVLSITKSTVRARRRRKAAIQRHASLTHTRKELVLRPLLSVMKIDAEEEEGTSETAPDVGFAPPPPSQVGGRSKEMTGSTYVSRRCLYGSR